MLIFVIRGWWEYKGCIIFCTRLNFPSFSKNEKRIKRFPVVASRSGLADCFCKWPDSTYFRLCGPKAKLRVLHRWLNKPTYRHLKG